MSAARRHSRSWRPSPGRSPALRSRIRASECRSFLLHDTPHARRTAGAGHAARGRRTRAGDRVRQRGEPAARPQCEPAARGGPSKVARRKRRAHHPTVDHRRGGARRRWRGTRGRPVEPDVHLPDAAGTERPAFGDTSGARHRRAALHRGDRRGRRSVAFGAGPAFAAWRVSLNAVLKSARLPRHIVLLRARRVRDGLAITEVALTVVLLVGTGLLLRSYPNVLRVPLGFRSRITC